MDRRPFPCWRTNSGAISVSFQGISRGAPLARKTLAEFNFGLGQLVKNNIQFSRSPGANTPGHFLWSQPMTQKELERQISQQTGESLQTIRNLGFSPLQTELPFEERNKPLMVDWDVEFQARFQRGGI